MQKDIQVHDYQIIIININGTAPNNNITVIIIETATKYYNSNENIKQSVPNYENESYYIRTAFPHKKSIDSDNNIILLTLYICPDS